MTELELLGYVKSVRSLLKNNDPVVLQLCKGTTVEFSLNFGLNFGSCKNFLVKKSEKE